MSGLRKLAIMVAALGVLLLGGACNGVSDGLPAAQGAYNAAGQVAPINTPTTGCAFNCNH